MKAKAGSEPSLNRDPTFRAPRRGFERGQPQVREMTTKNADVSIAGRVAIAKDVGMHPMLASDVTEGEHYTVLAYTDWADLFIPTVVRWANGENDSFTDLAVSRRNAREAQQAVAQGEAEL